MNKKAIPDTNDDSDEQEMTPESKKFWEEARKKFGRVVHTECDLQDMYIFWIEKQADGYLCYCTDDYENKHCKVTKLHTDYVPHEIRWMKQFADAGLKIGGRKKHPEDCEKQPKNSTSIAEIIASVKYKYNKSTYKLYLIRYLGEDMGSAVFVRREDLDPASLLLKSFEKQEKIKKGKFMTYELEYDGFTAKMPARIKDAIFKDQNVPVSVANSNSEEKKFDEKCTESNKVYRRKGPERIYAQNRKNRLLDLQIAKSEIRKEGSCVYDVLKHLLPQIPKRICNLFLTQKAKTWDGMRDLFFQILSKYCGEREFKFVFELNDCNESLETIINSNLNKNSGIFIIFYRVKGSFSGHCGLIVDGNIPDLIKINRKICLKAGEKKFATQEQNIMKEDLKRTISEIYGIQLSEKKNYECEKNESDF